MVEILKDSTKNHELEENNNLKTEKELDSRAEIIFTINNVNNSIGMPKIRTRLGDFGLIKKKKKIEFSKKIKYIIIYFQYRCS